MPVNVPALVRQVIKTIDHLGWTIYFLPYERIWSTNAITLSRIDKKCKYIFVSCNPSIAKIFKRLLEQRLVFKNIFFYQRQTGWCFHQAFGLFPPAATSSNPINWKQLMSQELSPGFSDLHTFMPLHHCLYNSWCCSGLYNMTLQALNHCLGESIFREYENYLCIFASFKTKIYLV